MLESPEGINREGTLKLHWSTDKMIASAMGRQHQWKQGTNGRLDHEGT